MKKGGIALSTLALLFTSCGQDIPEGMARVRLNFGAASPVTLARKNLMNLFELEKAKNQQFFFAPCAMRDFQITVSAPGKPEVRIPNVDPLIISDHDNYDDVLGGDDVSLDSNNVDILVSKGPGLLFRAFGTLPVDCANSDFNHYMIAGRSQPIDITQNDQIVTVPLLGSDSPFAARNTASSSGSGIVGGDLVEINLDNQLGSCGSIDQVAVIDRLTQVAAFSAAGIGGTNLFFGPIFKGRPGQVDLFIDCSSVNPIYRCSYPITPNQGQMVVADAANCEQIPNFPIP